MKPVTFGIIGAGRIGKLHADNLLNRVDGARLKAITDPFLDEDWAASRNIPLTGKDHRILLDDQEIDAILIGSPSAEHAPQMVECAEAGKHIFCEKPIALDPEIIRNALAEVDKSGVKLQVGFNRRFDPNFAAVQQQVASGALGAPHIIRITSRDPAPPPAEYVAGSGGMFLDMTIHDFDMARFLSSSEVTEVHAYGAVLVDPEIGKAGDIDTAVISLKFANGALGIIENSRKAVYGYDQRVEVFGAKGVAMADNNTPTSMIVLNESGTIRDKPLYFFLERYKTAFVSEMQAFLDAIREDKPTLVSGKDGLVPVLIAMAAKESLKTGKPVQVVSV
ncbi:MAG: inositol 2-dehydrogenase [SAR324 cluster bacterium]|jgi:myo-inositol 2-dehydrogenase/D-chiro-inositol 1-dehydrogenase|nr:inositol 2-dehydrogenase [SAR324 cluster bacterium]